MFALMSYEGDKGRTAPDSINNYFAYKTMKADAVMEWLLLMKIAL